MADNIAVTPGSGTNIATDDAGGAHYQIMKLADGTADSTTLIPLAGTLANGLYVDPHRLMVRVQQTPTISASAIYAAKDAVGGLLTFANAARVSAGSGTVVGVQIMDKDQERADLDLLLFDRTITAPTDNAAFDPSDTEIGYCTGTVRILAGDYADLNDNSVAHVSCDVPFVLNGTSLFGALVVRSTPTYTATSDIVVTLTIRQD